MNEWFLEKDEVYVVTLSLLVFDKRENDDSFSSSLNPNTDFGIQIPTEQVRA